jgi:LPXTG-motif cell wall-anchored protein
MHHKKLPKTGSPLPLLELAGALAMAAGYGVRRLRKS